MSNVDKYAVIEPGANEWATYQSLDEALEHVGEVIAVYRQEANCDGEWGTEVTGIVIAKITHRVRLDGDEDAGYDAVIEAETTNG